jgi:MFS family permease
MALGALQGPAASTLVERDPSGDWRWASAIASALTVGGAAGPLLAGLLAQYAALPLRLVFLAEVALLAVALMAVTARLPRARNGSDGGPGGARFPRVSGAGSPWHRCRCLSPGQWLACSFVWSPRL